MSSYHGWTHQSKADGGTDPIPGLGATRVFRALMANHSLTVGSDNQRAVEWDYWEFNDDSIYSEATFSGDYLISWRVKTPGLYIINASVNFSPDGEWNKTLILNDPYRNTTVTHGRTSDSFDDHYCLCTMRDFYIFWPGADYLDPTAPPSSAEMQLSLNQDSGSNQDAVQCEIIVARLPMFDVHTPTADLGFPAAGRIVDGGW